MAREYFKVTNIETGEDVLVHIPPAVQVIARQKLRDALNTDVRTGFASALFGALHRDVMMDVARDKLKPDAFFVKLAEWLWEYEPDETNIYDADGNVVTPPEENDGDKDDPDPLP
jgi:hypothetical protein